MITDVGSHQGQNMENGNVHGAAIGSSVLAHGIAEGSPVGRLNVSTIGNGKTSSTTAPGCTSNRPEVRPGVVCFCIDAKAL